MRVLNQHNNFYFLTKCCAYQKQKTKHLTVISFTDNLIKKNILTFKNIFVIIKLSIYLSMSPDIYNLKYTHTYEHIRT